MKNVKWENVFKAVKMITIVHRIISALNGVVYDELKIVATMIMNAVKNLRAVLILVVSMIVKILVKILYVAVILNVKLSIILQSVIVYPDFSAILMMNDLVVDLSNVRHIKNVNQIKPVRIINVLIHVNRTVLCVVKMPIVVRKNIRPFVDVSMDLKAIRLLAVNESIIVVNKFVIQRPSVSINFPVMNVFVRLTKVLVHRLKNRDVVDQMNARMEIQIAHRMLFVSLIL
ncbi:hypothetical protein BLA29_010594, partial [Euroglyphus maynei]